MDVFDIAPTAVQEYEGNNLGAMLDSDCKIVALIPLDCCRRDVKDIPILLLCRFFLLCQLAEAMELNFRSGLLSCLYCLRIYIMSIRFAGMPP